MPYSSSTSSSTILTWDDNPTGNATQAIIKDGEIVQFVVLDGANVRAILTTDPVLLAHIQTVIGELLAELTPAP